MAQDRPRRDPFERRTIWVLALAVLAFVLPSWGLAFTGEPEWWNVTLWIVGNALQIAADFGQPFWKSLLEGSFHQAHKRSRPPFTPSGIPT